MNKEDKKLIKLIVTRSIIIFIIMYIVAVLLGYVDIKVFGFLGKEKANIEREIFENNKSYVHGVIQDLGKYYHEYMMAKTQEDKNIISNVIRQRFAEFDASKIKSEKLRTWFIEVRGY